MTEAEEEKIKERSTILETILVNFNLKISDFFLFTEPSPVTYLKGLFDSGKIPKIGKEVRQYSVSGTNNQAFLLVNEETKLVYWIHLIKDHLEKDDDHPLFFRNRSISFYKTDKIYFNRILND